MHRARIPTVTPASRTVKSFFAKFVVVVAAWLAPIEAGVSRAALVALLQKSIVAGLGAGSLAAALSSFANGVGATATDPTLAAVLTFVAVHLAALILQSGQGSGTPPPPSKLIDDRFGPITIEKTPAGPSGPIFHSSEGYRSWVAAGKPSIR